MRRFEPAGLDGPVGLVGPVGPVGPVRPAREPNYSLGFLGSFSPLISCHSMGFRESLRFLRFLRFSSRSLGAVFNPHRNLTGEAITYLRIEWDKGGLNPHRNLTGEAISGLQLSMRCRRLNPHRNLTGEAMWQRQIRHDRSVSIPTGNYPVRRFSETFVALI